MSNMQQLIELGAVLSALDPVQARMCRHEIIQRGCDRLQELYEGYLRQDLQPLNVPTIKAQLRAYLMCKGTDKMKAREAIDSFVALAHKEMEVAMNGGVEIVVSTRNDTSYRGDKDDENARAVGESHKDTIDSLEFFFERM